MSETERLVGQISVIVVEGVFDVFGNVAVKTAQSLERFLVVGAMSEQSVERVFCAIFSRCKKRYSCARIASSEMN